MHIPLGRPPTSRNLISGSSSLCLSVCLSVCVVCVQLSKSAGQTKLPTEADLDKAFVLADENKNGTVCLSEFLHIYAMVKKGHVVGLAGNAGLIATTPKQQKKQLKNENAFVRGLNKFRFSVLGSSLNEAYTEEKEEDVEEGYEKEIAGEAAIKGRLKGRGE